MTYHMLWVDEFDESRVLCVVDVGAERYTVDGHLACYLSTFQRRDVVGLVEDALRISGVRW